MIPNHDNKNDNIRIDPNSIEAYFPSNNWSRKGSTCVMTKGGQTLYTTMTCDDLDMHLKDKE